MTEKELFKEEKTSSKKVVGLFENQGKYDYYRRNRLHIDKEVSITDIRREMEYVMGLFERLNPELNGKPSNMYVLERQVLNMRKQLSHCVPSCLILYLTISFAVMIVSLVLFILKHVYGIFIAKDFYMLSAFLMSATLFFTAIVAARDWKGKHKNGNEKEKERR